MERFIDFQPSVDGSEVEQVTIGQSEGATALETTVEHNGTKATAIDAPDPFGALRVWLAPNNLGAEVFRQENNHGR